ncbi:hypothetical protein Tco_1256747 [Tanacetum coccineum]
MGSNEDKTDQDIIRDLKQQHDQLDLAVIYYKRQKEEYQKTQPILNQTQRDKEEKYLNDIIQLQAKNKDLENVDNLRKSGLRYNGPYVLSQAYARIPKLYRAYELCNKNEQLHVFDYEETLKDAKKSQLKMNEFQKYEKVQELKIKPIDYRKLNKLYDDFVPQKELSAEQTYFPSSFISSKKVSSETKPSMASMPSANPMLVDLNEMENVFKKLNKDLHDETEKISKESKDVSNESKTDDMAKSIAFEIGLQHKSRENNSLKTLQKENENFMASLQIKNAHLKQTYKDLFDSVQRSRVETNHCDEVKVKVNFDEIETKNIELEYRVATTKFEAYLEKLEKTKVVLERQLARKVDDSKAEKDRFLKEINHLRTQLENLKGKRVETKLDNFLILGKPPLLNNERD